MYVREIAKSMQMCKSKNTVFSYLDARLLISIDWTRFKILCLVLLSISRPIYKI